MLIVKKKLQVFVSSTYIDMLEERQAVVQAILRAGHIPAGMELFAAGDESQLETIQRWIEDSDVFMLILGGRYGSIEPKSGKSYIQLEYEYASSLKKPFFAAVIEQKLLDSKIEKLRQDATERNNGALLDAFREIVMKKICRPYGDTKDLTVIVFESLGDIERRDDLAGWIHGSDVIDPTSTLKEMERLQKENTELRQKVVEQSVLSEQEMSPEVIFAKLTEEEKALLMASEHASIDIYADHEVIMTGQRNFVTDPKPRSYARWRAAAGRLVQRGLCEESYSSNLSQLRASHLGYQVIDLLKASGWRETPEDVTE